MAVVLVGRGVDIANTPVRLLHDAVLRLVLSTVGCIACDCNGVSPGLQAGAKVGQQEVEEE